MGRVGRPTNLVMAERKRWFWRLVRAGASVEEARLEAGMSEAQAYRELRKALGPEGLAALIGEAA